MYKLGIDLGGTNIAAGIVDENYNVVVKYSMPTCLPDSPKNIVGRIYEVSDKALKRANLTMDDITSIGIGSPGAVDSKNGIVIFANNLNFSNVKLGDMLSDKFGKKVLCENDANAAAFGEYLVSENKPNTLVAITIGTGIGGGIIINGKVYSGSRYSGGELGHMVINFNGKKCSCGRRGGFEVYASANALIEQTKEAMQKNLNSAMWSICGGNISDVTGKTAFEGLRKGDETARQVIEQYTDYVSVGLVDIINTIGPDMICISGGISNEGECLLRFIRKHIELNKPINCKTVVEVAKLGNDAGIVGAANLDLQ